MNLNELWLGTDYAYYPGRRNQEVYRRFDPDVNERKTWDEWYNDWSYSAYRQVFRVKILQKIQKEEEGKSRRVGYAQILYCDPETGEPLENEDESHKVAEIRARDIALRWEEYWDEHEHKEAEREAAEERRRKEDEERRKRYEEEQEHRRLERIEAERERERLRLERERIENIKREAIKALLQRIGIRDDMLTIGYDNISINRRMFEEEVLCLIES